MPIISNAQISLPHYTGFNNASRTKWMEGQFKLGGATDPLLPMEFSLLLTLLGHSHPIGGKKYTDDWMVSPEFDFSKGAILNFIQYRIHGFGYTYT